MKLNITEYLIKFTIYIKIRFIFLLYYVFYCIAIYKFRYCFINIWIANL